jgi:Fic family protein
MHSLSSRFELQKAVSLESSAHKYLTHIQVFQSPVTSVKEAEDSLEISYTTANDLINSMVEMNILEEMTGNSRNRVFIFRRYVDTFGEQGRDIHSHILH